LITNIAKSNTRINNNKKNAKYYIKSVTIRTNNSIQFTERINTKNHNKKRKKENQYLQLERESE
jgi:hypothetical protein